MDSNPIQEFTNKSLDHFGAPGPMKQSLSSLADDDELMFATQVDQKEGDKIKLLQKYHMANFST